MTLRNEAETGLTREEAAEMLRVSLSTVDRYLRDGTLPKSKLGKRLVRINRSDVLDLLVLTAPASDASSPEADALGAGVSSSVGAA